LSSFNLFKRTTTKNNNNKKHQNAGVF